MGAALGAKRKDNCESAEGPLAKTCREMSEQLLAEFAAKPVRKERK